MIIASNRTRMSPAAFAAGLSAYKCNNCKKYLSKEFEESLLANYVKSCEYCGAQVWADDVSVHVLPTYADLLRVSGVRARTWYHATTMQDWSEALVESEARGGRAPYVHIGSKESACALADLKHSKGDVWYLNKISLRAGWHVAPKVFDDDNYWPEDSKDVSSFEGFSEITRYVNRYEIPGSISLLVDYRAVRVLETRRLTRAEVRGTLVGK